MGLIEQFSEALSEDCVPVKGREIVCPTRVTFKNRSNGKISTRVFPTLMRAWDFAAEEPHVVSVGPVTDELPEQPMKINRAFKRFVQKR